MRKKIGILYCGGLKHNITSQGALDLAMQDFEELKFVSDVSFIYVPGALHQKEHSIYQRAALAIKEHWYKFDGFTIFMPEDNFLFNADLLAYMLGDLGKPVVCTPASPDAQEITSDRYSTIRQSFMSAVQGAGGDFGGCGFVVGRAIMPITHVAFEEGRTSRYVSADKILLATIGIGVKVTDYTNPRTEIPPHLQLAFEESIEFVREPEAGKPLLQPSVVEHVGSLSMQELEALALAPVLVLHENSVSLVEDHVLHELDALTPDSAAAKFSWCLGQIQRTDLLHEEKERTLHEWMKMPMLNEFLLST